MPRAESLSSFHPSYEQLLLRAHAHLSEKGDEFTIQFDSPNKASGMRLRVYAYFRALKSSTARPDLTALCGDLSVRCAGCALVLFRKGEGLDGEDLRAALGLEPGFHETNQPGLAAPSHAHASDLARLHALRAGKKPTK